MELDGHHTGCLGDLKRYPDGTESKIASSASSALAYIDPLW